MPVFQQSDPFEAGNYEDDSDEEDEEKVPAKDKIFAEWLKIKR
jgi:hypothetical protein